MQAILSQMNHEESQEKDRHLGTQADIRSIKIQMDRLSGAVGELVTAFKGNDLGTEGIVAEVRRVVEDQRKLKDRFDNLERMAKTNQRYLLAFIGSIGVVLGGAMKSIFDHLFKK